jgi:predicted Zn-dependent protease
MIRKGFIMKKNSKWRISGRAFVVLLGIVLLIVACVTNPLTGKSTMALIHNNQLLPIAFAEYDEFLSENTVIANTADARMVERVGSRLAVAAQKWLEANGSPHYLDDYRWEYKLVQDDQVNAWCMPGGKIVVYTGILPVTKTEEGLAVVLGHELSHALLNHGQQNMSAGYLQQLGLLGVQIGAQAAGLSSDATDLLVIGTYLTSSIAGLLPFSRSNESEADHYGLILMAIAGYNPDAAAPFWERMNAMAGSNGPEWLSTHPSPPTRIKQLQGWNAEAKKKAAEFGVRF